MTDGSHWRIADDVLDLQGGVLLGVLNVTPDSFSDGGDYVDVVDAVEAGRRMRADGAHLVDVGGESARPGAVPVTADEELSRVVPVLEALAQFGVPTSIDTSKPVVARAGIEAGARVVNDVTGFRDGQMVEVVASTGAGVIVMHMLGEPRTMQEHPRYDDVVVEVGDFLRSQAEMLTEAGVEPDAIVVDPGFGFGKTSFHNLELINRLPELVELGYPVMLGTSRKSTLQQVTGVPRPKDRDGHTAITTALGYERGARVFRVHNVAASLDALRIAAAIVDPRTWEEWQQD